MDFTSQLKTLLWKNYVLRRKKPLRLFAELIWPLVIFTSLALIKIKFRSSLITDMKECHFEDIPLLSSGLLGFFRGLYCNIDFPCYSEVKDGLQMFPHGGKGWSAEDELRHFFMSERIFEVSQELETFFEDLSKVNIKYVLSEMMYAINYIKPLILPCFIPLNVILGTDMVNTFPLLKNSILSLQDMYEFSDLFMQSGVSLDLFTSDIFDEICSHGKIITFSNSSVKGEFCELSQETVDVILKEIFTNGSTNIGLHCSEDLDLVDYFRMMDLTEELQKMFALRFELVKTTEYMTDIEYLVMKSRENQSDVEFDFRRTICGRKSLRNSYSFLNLLSPAGFLNPQALRDLIYSVRNDSSEFCQLSLLSLKITSYLSLGKILYTPVTPETEKLIKLANQTFENLDKIIKLTSEIELLLSDLLEVSKNVLLKEIEIFLTMFSFYDGARLFLSVLTVDGLQTTLQEIRQSLREVLRVSECFELNRFQGVENEEELAILGQKLGKNRTFLAGLVFFVEENATGKADRPLSYKVRLHQSFVDLGFKYNIEGETKRGSLPTNPRIASRYMRSGFVILQDLIDHAIISLEKTADDVGSILQLFPSPCYVEDVFKLILVRTFPLFMILAWIVMVPLIVKDIVFEKETQLKQFMKVMGLSREVHWVSWFVFYLCSMTISVLLLSALIKFGKILEFTNIFLLFVFVFVFVIALITQCFMFSVFFNNSNAAATFTVIAYFSSFLPFRFCVFHIESMLLWHKMLASLSFTTAFGLGCNSLAIYESLRKGMQWHYVFTYPSPKDKYSFALSIAMMLFDSVLYMAIALYVEAVWPGSYGIAKPWHFPLSGPIKWLLGYRHRFVSSNQSLNNSLQFKDLDVNHHEGNEGDLPVGVLVHRLTKRYEKKKPLAVNNLTAEFYEGHISSLLGHNGAGKTSTMFVMTGLMAPSEGTVYIKGLDVRTKGKEIKKIISFCPQHNILYGSLSVWQHLLFYGKLKGLKDDELISECNRAINDLELRNKKDVESQYLSGGTMRRLSVGIAYLGSPEVIILDEPTAGVDARARRFIWDLILKYKAGRTTILSTHLMEEAEVLSDRLAIINKGKLYCSGSMMFLKNHFAFGYRLTAEFQKESFTENSKQDLVDLVTNTVQDAEVDRTMFFPYTITFILPLTSSDQFPNLFKQIELQKEKFALSTYGVSSPTVEEIFVNVNNAIDASESRNNSALNYEEIENFTPCPNFKPLTGIGLVTRQLLSLMVKRFHYLRRNKKSIFCQLILPPIFLLLTLAVLKFVLSFNLSFEHSLKLVPKMHSEEELNFFLSRNKKIKWQPDYLEESLVHVLGSKTECLQPSLQDVSKATCSKEDVRSKISYSDAFQSNFSVNCSCFTGWHQCDSKVVGTLPKNVSLNNGDVVFNLTHFDISSYLLKTHQNFSDKRFAGFEFASSKYPKQAILNNMEHILNLTENVAAALNKNISARTWKLLGGLRDIYPHLIKDNYVKVWFNFERPASVVTYLNSLHNALLRGNDSEDSSSKGYFSVYDHPLNSTEEEVAEVQSILEILPSICVMLAMSIIPTTFLFVLIEERQSGFMHLQMISGVNSTIYWISNIIWDSVNYCLTSAICIGVFYIFNVKEFVSSDNISTFVALLFAYGWAVIPLTYPFAFVFKEGNIAYIFTAGGYFFSGLIPTTIMFVFDFIPKEKDEQNWADFLRSFFLIIPQFCLGRGLMEMINNQISYVSQVAVFGKRAKFKSPMAFDMIGRYIASLLIFGVITMIAFLVVEYFSGWEFRFLKKIWSKKSNMSMSNSGIEDDIIEEEERVLNNPEGHILVVKQITKDYRNRVGCYKHTQFKALNEVTFGVKEGECFGLLGTNGAGKTTLFKILTGDIKPTSGDAFLNNLSVREQITKVRKHFGYCPQFDALCTLMNVREHLILFAKLRGAADSSLEGICDWGLKRLDLSHHVKTLSKNLSGGNKRKLSVALSLIGKPDIVYMDEPTAGIDPRARRSVWNCILGSIRSGLSVILTSHSLEECEALCSRVAIIVAGNLRCIGTIQHLKSKYSKGYYLSVKFAGDGSERSNFENLLHHSFSDVSLEEQHARYSNYLLADSSLQLSKVFQMLSEAKKSGLLHDFSINQTRLEQVFLKFANTSRSDRL